MGRSKGKHGARRRLAKTASSGSTRSNAQQEAAQEPYVDPNLQAHIAEIEQALAGPQGPDVLRLREIAAMKGLATNALRARTWHLIAGLPRDENSFDANNYLGWHSTPHRDSPVVKVDVERSLHAFTRQSSDEQRATKRAALKRLLDAAVNCHGEGAVYYYQGLHDIASVLLLVLGEHSAFHLLRHLVTHHLRDATRAGLDAVIEVLGLMYPLLRVADAPLAVWLSHAALQPYFALAWLITWWAHDAEGLQDAARLFDLFLSTHPLMPLYVGAVAMRAEREALLACEEMPELHTALVNMRPTARLSMEELTAQALQLFQEAPPELLVANRRTAICCAVLPAAVRSNGDDDTWHIPDSPPEDWGEPAILVSMDETEAEFDAYFGNNGKHGSGTNGNGGGGGPFSIMRFVFMPGRMARGERGSGNDGKRRRPGAVAALSIGGLLSVYMIAALMAYAVRPDAMGGGGRGSASGLLGRMLGGGIGGGGGGLI